MATIQASANRAFDALVRPRIRLGRSEIPAYRFFGGLGWLLAISWSTVLVLHQGLALWVVGVLCLGTAASLLGLVIVVKVLTGRERLVNYTHQVLALAVAAIVLRTLNQPVLPYLDVVAVGLGLFLACGRIGCLMSGCCHGKPHSWGVCYRPHRGHEGTSPHLFGVRLLPVQALSSAWLAFTAVVGSLLVLSGAAQGSALSWYIAAYGCGRFALEFLRGDPGRFHRWGLSAAQWTSLLVVLGGSCAGWWQVFPGGHVYLVALAVLCAGVAGTLMYRGRSGRTGYWLFHPDHLAEVAELIAWAGQHEEDEIRSACTTHGLQLSAGRTVHGNETIRHLALSCLDGPPTYRTVHRLADTVCHLAQAKGRREIAVSNHGVIHLLIHEPSMGGAE